MTVTLASPQQAPGRTTEAPVPTPPEQAAAPAPAAPTPLATAMAMPGKPGAAPAKGAAEGLAADAPTEETPLVGGQPFQPSETVRQYIESKGEKGARVNVRFGTVAAGPLHVVKGRGGYKTPDGPEGLPLTLALLSPLAGLPLNPVLAVTLKDGVMSGYATVGDKRRRLLDRNGLLNALEKHADALGWLGLTPPSLPVALNTVEGDKLIVTSDKVSFKLGGGFLTAAGSFGIENQAVTFAATATGKVEGLATITLDIKRSADGALTGTGEVPLQIEGFSGVLKVAFGRGLVDIEGTVSYANEKFAGEITIVATDKASAEALVASKTPQPPPAAGAGPATTGTPAPVGATEAAPAAPAPPAILEGPKPGPRVIAGWGTVKVQLAEWLSGDALVVVDPAGHVTIVGKITPKMEKPLFEQRDYIKALPKLEVRALYGVPLVGNVFLFANIGLEALAKIGPATLDRMEIVGTYSTDPKVLQNFSLTGTLNISAFAGLRVRAEGGVGVEILDHDIKAGAAITALAGIRGYVDATPTIGYREVVDPAAGKKGEFFIAGDLQIAAQPFLGLGGELFVELDSPWWSPAPDERWTWPLGQLEYPLPGEFGIGAHVEHVLGSGKVPELEFKQVEFNADRFMTDLLNDHVPPKKSTDEQKKGKWEEKPVDAPAPAAGEGPAAAPELTGSKPPDPAKGATGHQPEGVGEPPKLANEKRWADGMKALGELAKKSTSDPQDPAELGQALARIKKDHGFTELTPTLDGEVWDIHAAMNPDTKDKDVKIKAARRKRSRGRAKDIGLLVHRWAETLSEKGLLTVVLPGGGEVLLTDPKSLGKAEVPVGGGIVPRGRIDRLNEETFIVYEIKPDTSKEQARAQGMWYVERLHKERLQQGNWQVHVVYYNMDKAEDYFIEIGLLDPETKSEDIWLGSSRRRTSLPPESSED
jgi:hypothetical protein